MTAPAPFITIRPEPGCSATLDAARAMGMDARGFPMFTITPQDWTAPDPASIDALLIGSANALRHCGPQIAAFAGMPAYAVGETTARASRAVGLDVITAGGRGLQPVLNRIEPQHRRLLRLAGQERIALSIPPGATMAECVVYAAEAQPMPAPLADMLAQRRADAPAIVALHSAQAARHFAAECQRLGLPRAAIALVVIGPRVARAAREGGNGDTASGTGGWAALACADRPEEAALLAQAIVLCQSDFGSPVKQG